MHLLSEDQLEESHTSNWSTNVKLIIHLVDNHAHAYTIYHIISSLMHSWYSFVHIHAIGSPKGVMLLEFQNRALGGAASSIGAGRSGGRWSQRKRSP